MKNTLCLNMRFNKIAVGISGGVDSAVAALLLKRKDFDVQGVFMRNWDGRDENGFCSAESDYEDASTVCNKINIPLHRVDFIKEYWNEVFTYLLSEYERGRTPNPDIMCNRHVKFDSFYKYCRNVLKVDAIATGHYANSSFGPYLEKYNEDEGVRLLCPLDNTKDQTFFLSQVNQQPLRRTMFPLATLLKTDVRKIARQEGLNRVVEKKESMGICFIGKRQFKDFIEEYIRPKPGKLIDIDTGKSMGDHNGVHQWTIGQRAHIGGLGKPYFILQKELSTNTIYVAGGTDHPALHSKVVMLDHPHWIHSEPPELVENSVLHGQFRFQHTKWIVDCRVMKYTDGLVVILNSPLRALTQGQFGVLYRDGECLGSGRMEHVGPSLALVTNING